MTYLAILAALALIPMLAVLLLRVNGAVAFMSLALGSVLVTYTSSDVNAIFGGFTTSGTLSKYQWVQLGLLVTPFLLTVVFARGAVKGSKRFINFLPALSTGLLFALLVVPLLSADMQHHIHIQPLWHQLDSLQTAVILGGAAFSMLFLLLTHRVRHGDDEKTKKSH